MTLHIGAFSKVEKSVRYLNQIVNILFLEKLKPNQTISESAEHGIEIFILAGELISGHYVYPT